MTHILPIKTIYRWYNQPMNGISYDANSTLNTEDDRSDIYNQDDRSILHIVRDGSQMDRDGNRSIIPNDKDRSQMPMSEDRPNVNKEEVRSIIHTDTKSLELVPFIDLEQWIQELTTVDHDHSGSSKLPDSRNKQKTKSISSTTFTYHNDAFANAVNVLAVAGGELDISSEEDEESDNGSATQADIELYEIETKITKLLNLIENLENWSICYENKLNHIPMTNLAESGARAHQTCSSLIKTLIIKIKQFHAHINYTLTAEFVSNLGLEKPNSVDIIRNMLQPLLDMRRGCVELRQLFIGVMLLLN